MQACGVQKYAIPTARIVRSTPTGAAARGRRPRKLPGWTAYFAFSRASPSGVDVVVAAAWERGSIVANAKIKGCRRVIAGGPTNAYVKQELGVEHGRLQAAISRRLKAAAPKASMSISRTWRIPETVLMQMTCSAHSRVRADLRYTPAGPKVPKNQPIIKQRLKRKASSSSRADRVTRPSAALGAGQARQRNIGRGRREGPRRFPMFSTAYTGGNQGKW